MHLDPILPSARLEGDVREAGLMAMLPSDVAMYRKETLQLVSAVLHLIISLNPLPRYEVLPLKQTQSAILLLWMTLFEEAITAEPDPGCLRLVSASHHLPSSC